MVHILTKACCDILVQILGSSMEFRYNYLSDHKTSEKISKNLEQLNQNSFVGNNIPSESPLCSLLPSNIKLFWSKPLLPLFFTQRGIISSTRFCNRKRILMTTNLVQKKISPQKKYAINLYQHMSQQNIQPTQAPEKKLIHLHKPEKTSNNHQQYLYMH